MKLLLALAGALLGGSVVDALLGTWSPTHYCRITSTGLDSSINVPQGGLLGIGQFVFDSYARTLSHRIVHGLNITSSNSWTFNYTNSWSGSLASGPFSLSIPQGSTLMNKNITNPMVGSVWLGNEPNVDAYIQGGRLAIHISNSNGLVGRCNLFGIYQQEVELIAPSNAGVHSFLTVNYDNNGLSFVPPVFPNSSNSNNGATGLQNSNNSNNNNNQASASAFIDFDEATSMTVFSINTGVTNNSNMDVYLACGSVICWYNTTNQALIQGVAYCPSFINGNCSILSFVNNSNTFDPNADRFNMSNLAWTGLIRGPIVLTTMMGFNSMNTSQLGAAILYGTNIESSPIIVDLDVILPSRPANISVSKGLLGQQLTPILSNYDLSSVPFNNFTNGYWSQSIRFNVSAPVSTIQSYLNILSASSPSDMDVVLSVTSVNGNVIDASFEALTVLNTDTYYTHTCFLIPSVNFSSSNTAASPFAGAGVFSYNADTQVLSFALLHTLQNPGAGWLSMGYPGEVGTQIASIPNSTSPIVGAVMLSSTLAVEFWRDHLFLSFPGIQNGARCQIVGKDSQEVALSVIQSPLVAPGTTPTPSGPTSTPTTAYATTAPISPTTNSSIAPTTTGVLPTTVVPTTNSSIAPTTTGILPTTANSTSPTPTGVTAVPTTAAASVLPTTVIPTTASGAGARRRLLQVFSSTAALSSTGVESSSSTGLESSSSSSSSTGLESSSSSSTGLESSSSSSSTASSSSTGIESSSTGAESSSTGAVPTTITPTTPSVLPTTLLPTTVLPTTLLPTTPTTALPTSVLPTSPTIAPTTIPATSAVIVPTSSIPTSASATTAPVSTEAPFSGCLLRLNRLNRKLWYNCNAVASAGPLQSLVIQDMNGANLFTLGCANINCNGTLALTASQLSEYVAGHWSFVFNGQSTSANRLVSHAAVQTTIEDFVLYNFTAPMSWSQRLVAQFPANSVDATDVNFWTPLITNIPVRPVFSLAVALFWQGANGTTVLSSGSNYTMSGLPVLSSIVFANFQPSMAHIHGPARPGVNTGVLIPITVNTNESSVTNTWVGVINQATESIKFLDYMAMELLYENVHSPTWPDGEVRGQLFPIHLKTCPVPDRFDMLAF